MIALATSVAEINRLHREACHLASQSRQCLNGSLQAAWQAGRLLAAERIRARRLGEGAWGFWLEQNFRGTARTAQRYMKLARLVPDVSVLQGVSLRQAYARLGIATEPKTRRQGVRLRSLPGHVLHANRLLRVLKQRGGPHRWSPAEIATRRADLRIIYELLRPLYEPTAS